MTRLHTLQSTVRRLSACARAACIVSALATSAAFAQSGTPLNLVFNTTSLGTFPTPSGTNYGVWSAGQTVDEDNVYVSFQWSDNLLHGGTTATNFYAMIGGTTSLRWTGTYALSPGGTTQFAGPQTGGGWYVNDVLSGTGLMSPAFSIRQMNGSSGTTGSQIYHLQGQNLFIEYGQNTIGSGPSNWSYVQTGGVGVQTYPSPNTTNPHTRYNDIELTYVPGGLGGGNNNADLTAINNVGSALGLTYTPGTSGFFNSVAYTGHTQDLLPTLATLTSTNNLVLAPSQGATPAPVVPPVQIPPLASGSGNYLAGILSAAQVPQSGNINSSGNFLTSYPAYIANVLSGTLGSPLLTNQTSGPNPGANPPGIQGFTGPGGNNYLVGMFFKPEFTPAGSTYDITLSGSIVATQVGGPGSYTYGTGTTGVGAANPLKIKIASAFTSGTNAPAADAGFYGYLANGNVNNSNVTLDGDLLGALTGWNAFSTDFYQGGYGNGSQGGPSALLVTGALATSGTTDSIYYGQIVQRALGDLQELLMVGAFGNESTVTLIGGTTASGTAFAYTGPLGGAPSGNVWTDKSNAYLNTGTSGFNPLGKYLWTNSQNVTGTTTSQGAVYSNPYDDRFSNDGAVTLHMGDYGGTLTIDLREVAVVPEPSALALLTVAGATLGGLAWRRRRGPAS